MIIPTAEIIFFGGVLTCFYHQPDDYRKLVPNIFAAKNSMSKFLWLISLHPKAELQHQREVFELRRRQAGKN
jgi:hypothetical protein